MKHLIHTIRRSGLKGLIAGLILAVTVPGVALAASHPFTDVPDGLWYSDAVEWAYNNGITTGVSPTEFAPDENVTRAQNVTFAMRYHDNIAQPAFDALQAGIDANTGSIDGLLKVVGYATVLSDGTVVDARSSGVAGANVTLEVVSSYCFRDLGFDFTTADATPLYEGGAAQDVEAMVGLPGVAFGAGDCAGTDAVLEIATAEDSTYAPHGFTVVFYG